MATSDLAPVRRALISVSDKDGLVDRARRLVDAGVDILSTGGIFMRDRADCRCNPREPLSLLSETQPILDGA